MLADEHDDVRVHHERPGQWVRRLLQGGDQPGDLRRGIVLRRDGPQWRRAVHAVLQFEHGVPSGVFVPNDACRVRCRARSGHLQVRAPTTNPSEDGGPIYYVEGGPLPDLNLPTTGGESDSGRNVQ